MFAGDRDFLQGGLDGLVKYITICTDRSTLLTATQRRYTMNRKQIAYWVLTALFCLAMGISGFLNLTRFEGLQESITDLGYPVYLMSILGVAKLLGVIALLIPKAPRLKEWAYAGFAFDMLGASASHAFSGHAAPEIMVPLVVLLTAIGSYVLRPSDRRLASNGGDVPLDSSDSPKAQIA